MKFKYIATESPTFLATGALTLIRSDKSLLSQQNVKGNKYHAKAFALSLNFLLSKSTKKHANNHQNMRRLPILLSRCSGATSCGIEHNNHDMNHLTKKNNLACVIYQSQVPAVMTLHSYPTYDINKPQLSLRSRFFF